MRKFTTRDLTLAAVVGALYVVLSYFGNIFGLTYGPIQFRFAEALTVLPFLFPGSTWGLFVGCIISNILSPYGLPDLIFGSAATLIAALLSARCRTKWLAPLPPVVCNGVLVGGLIAFQQTGGFSGAFWPAFTYNGITVAVGELLVCYILGMILLNVLPRIPGLKIQR